MKVFVLFCGIKGQSIGICVFLSPNVEKLESFHRTSLLTFEQMKRLTTWIIIICINLPSFSNLPIIHNNKIKI